jgi:hypothetical protein
MLHLPLAYSAVVIFSDFGVVEIRSIFADSLAMCGVADRDWIKALVERIWMRIHGP